MGSAHSLDAFFGSETRQADAEQADVYQYLRRVERTLWRTPPWWEDSQSNGNFLDVGASSRPSGARKLEAAPRDPKKKLSVPEALVVIPELLGEAWISPLVALADSEDPIARSSGLALLSRVVSQGAATEIFLAVGGMEKVMGLLDNQDRQAMHLALEVIYALCTGNSSVVLPFCEAGLIGRLAMLVKGDSPELVLASLKILRLTLRQSAVKAEMPGCKMLSVLMELVHSPHASIAKAAVVCIGLSLPNTENLAEMLRLGCIDVFLRLMVPSNPSADAVIFALSLIADETDAIFPREQTTLALARMLETLRGAAKRSMAASATSFLFASLAKSSVFHGAICSETNLGILSKLLVGGSPDVLAATCYALGIVALHADDRVRLTLFQVDAPSNLVQLVVVACAGPSANRDEKVACLAVFALAGVTDEALVSHRAGALVCPELLTALATTLEPLRTSSLSLCNDMQSDDVLPHVHARAVKRFGPGSSYALKLVSALSPAAHVRDHLADTACVKHMFEYLRGASAIFLRSLFVLLLECCGCDDACGCDDTLAFRPRDDTKAVEGSMAFCQLVERSPGALRTLGELFQTHPPEHLLGLAPLLAALASHSASLKAQLSESNFFVDQMLSAATRLNLVALHEQALGFLVRLSALKNHRALEQLFASDPDRVANLLRASASIKVQLLAATLLRRLFKHLNRSDIPSGAARRHLAKLLVPSTSTELAVPVAACRVWGNLLQFEDKRVAFAELPDAVSGLLLLLQRCSSTPLSDTDKQQIEAMREEPRSDISMTEAAREKLQVPSALKPLYRVVRTTYRSSSCETTRQAIVSAPHFLCLVDLFSHACDPVARLAIDTMSEVASTTAPGLRRALAVPAVLNAVQQLLRDRERAATGRGVMPQRRVLRFLGLLARKDAAIQHLVVESKLLDALVLLLHDPATATDPELLAEALDALAWVCSALQSPGETQMQAEMHDEAEPEAPSEGEAPARCVVATVKTIALALRHTDSEVPAVARASLHVLQRIACEQPRVPKLVFEASGASVIMRALQQRPERTVRRRACALVRHLVRHHEGNRGQFQELGVTSFLVALVTSAGTDVEPSEAANMPRKLRIKGLQALAALCEGASPAAKACKQELLECEQSAELLRLVHAGNIDDTGLCSSWTRALAMGAMASSTNQRRLVNFGIVPLLVQLLKHSSGRVRVPAAKVLAYLAQAPETRGTILLEGGEALLAAVIACLQSELPGLQRFTALFIAHAATRHEGNKVRLGAAGAAAALIDRLSSQRVHVLENVLLAVIKLGSHAGNKVKLGGKVCFEKLLALVHHDTLAVAKGAARALAVLVTGNDANKRFLLQCEAPVVAELSALLKGSNGTIVESAMLVLGELAPLPAQALELSRCVDVLAVVRLLTHVNPRIGRAALLVVRHLTRESFNKLRFGLQECVDALLERLWLGLTSAGGVEELELVELAITCLGNLSFVAPNAERIVEARKQAGGSLLLLLQLAATALPTATTDYLSTKERGRLTLENVTREVSTQAETSPERGEGASDSEEQQDEGDEEIASDIPGHSPKKPEVSASGITSFDKSHEVREQEEVAAIPTLDFRAFPSLQTAVLEQTLLVLNNCSEYYRSAGEVDAVAVAVLCQALRHPSELVDRCACYLLACWCKVQLRLQDVATRRGALPTLAQLLTSPSLEVVEAAAYALAKLATRGDNPAKLLALDVPATLVHSILRKAANMPHDRVLDRAARLLGTLARFPRVRQVLKGEEIIADVLTPLLQLHPQALAKNLSRLVLALLAEDSLKFFLPKKTVALLRACLVHPATVPKTVRNVLHVFAHIAVVEEHKTTIALEDSGEALARMVQELHVDSGNVDTVLGLLAGMADTRRVAAILHERDVYVELPPYMVDPVRVVAGHESVETNLPSGDSTTAASPPPPPAAPKTQSAESAEQTKQALETRHLHAVQIIARLCEALGEGAERRLSELETSRLLITLLRSTLMKLSSMEGREQGDEESSDKVSGDVTTALSPLTATCLDILRRLCVSKYDEALLVEERAVEVFAAYLEIWLTAASGRPTEGLQPLLSGDDSLVLAFAVSLTAITRTLSAQTPGRELLVQVGGFRLVLDGLGLGTTELPDTQRDQLAEALARLSPLPQSVPVFEATPELVAPLFRFMVAPQTQIQPRLLILALRVFADVMEVSPASRAFVLSVTGGTVQPLPFLLSCLSHDSSTSGDAGAKILHSMRSLQCLATDPAVAQRLAPLTGLPAVAQLLTLKLPPPPAHDVRLESVQFLATEMLGYLAFFGHAPRLCLDRAAVDRLVGLADFSRDERVTPEGIALSTWTLALLATPQNPPRAAEEDLDAIQAEIDAAATCVRTWVTQDPRGLDVLVSCGLRPPGHLDLPSSVTANVVSILAGATAEDLEARAVVPCLVRKRVCTPLASMLEAVEPDIRGPALQLLARLLPEYSWAEDEPPTEDENADDDMGAKKSAWQEGGGEDEGPEERWSVILLQLTEWMQVYAQDPHACPLDELCDAYTCLSVLTAQSDLARELRHDQGPRGLMDLIATALHHYGDKKLPSRPESLILIRKESAMTEEALEEAAQVAAERAKADWQTQFNVVLHALRACRRIMAFSNGSSDRAVQLRVPMALDNLVLLHDRRILDEALRCMLHLAMLRGTETQLLFSSDRTVARLKALLQSESRALQARVTPLLALMAVNMPTLPGLSSMDGILILVDLAVSSSPVDVSAKYVNDCGLDTDRRVYEDACVMLLALFCPEEGVIIAFDVAEVVPKLFSIVERVSTACVNAYMTGAEEAPSPLELPLRVLVKVSTYAHSHARYMELLARICRLLDGVNGPARRTGRWCEMLLSILFNVFGCPHGGEGVVAKTTIDTLEHGQRTLLPQLLPLERWVAVAERNATSGRLVVELLRAFMGDGEPSSAYAALFNSGDDIPALLKLVGASSTAVAIPAAQLLLTATQQRDVRVAVTVADGVPALVAALCRAENTELQELLLSLLLALGRGDSEVLALLLGASGGVARLVHFVQEQTAATDTNGDHKMASEDSNPRLTLSCALLMELSRAHNGPAHIVEVHGHVALLALSTQQQKQQETLQAAQTTVGILTNLTAAGVGIAPALISSKLPAHFLQCLLEVGQNSELPFLQRLALTGLLTLAKASQELRSELAKSALLVVLLEELLLGPEKPPSEREDQEIVVSVIRDALVLLYMMSTTDLGCISLAQHASSEILNRICGVIMTHVPHGLDQNNGDGARDNEEADQATPVEVSSGLMLLANLLDVAQQQENKPTWRPKMLLKLAPLLQGRVAAHESPKRQLPALRILRGAFALRDNSEDALENGEPTNFYFPLAPQLLAELLTVLLVSASRQHRESAERVVVCAFRDHPERARASVAGTQILEQLLIVFTQSREDSGHQRATGLAAALTEVLYVSVARGFVVGQRSLSKLPALLGSYASDSTPPGCEDANQPVKRALSVYLGFVFASSPVKSPIRSAIRDTLRADGTSRRTTGVLVEQLLFVHDQLCVASPGDEDASISLTTDKSPSSDDLSLWTCVIESVHPLTTPLAEIFTSRAPLETWFCLLRDWFQHVVRATEPRMEDVVLENACRMLSVLTQLASNSATSGSDDDSLIKQKEELCAQSLAALSCVTGPLEHAPNVIETSLQALLDAREAWGDACVLAGCLAFEGTTALLPRLLGVFHAPDRSVDRSRHIVLQLLLLLASTGHFVEELKAAGVRAAVENNALIVPTDKALPVALLSMLGYSADLNEEFERALVRLEKAATLEDRSEHVAYLLRFLERYSLTHEPTEEHGIHAFMTLLVGDAEKAQATVVVSERELDGGDEAKQEPEEDPKVEALTVAIIGDCLVALNKLAGSSTSRTRMEAHHDRFASLYLTRWDLNALMAVAFARQRGDENNKFQERPRLALPQITQILALAGHVRSKLEAGNGVVGHIDERWFINAFELIARHLGEAFTDQQQENERLLLVEQVLDLLHWLATHNAECFARMLSNASLLRVFFKPLTPVFCGAKISATGSGENALELFLTLVEMVANLPAAGSNPTVVLDQLLGDLLAFVYAQADTGLRQGPRARLLVCILVMLQRIGDAGRAACAAYEDAIRQVLWHVHAHEASENQARCSWELLGPLSQLDPAITALFNLDGIPTLLRECGCDTETPKRQTPAGGWRSSRRAKMYRLAEALKCLSRAARTHDEVLLKVGEAPGIALVLFGALPAAANENANVSRAHHQSGITSTTQVPDVGATQAHAAHLIARIAGQEDLRASLLSPENVSLLIESLESVHLAVVLHALQALAHLCSFALCLDALVRHATVPVLAQILFSPLARTERCREIEACVLVLLGKMCARSQTVSRRVVSSNLLPKLRDFLVVEKQSLSQAQQQDAQPSEPSIHHNAVWVISSLSKDSELVSKLVAHGILETLCEEVSSYAPITTQRKALGAMSRLVGSAAIDSETLRSVIAQAVESVRRSVPFPEAQSTVANGLAVFVAIAKAGKSRYHSQQQRRTRRPQSQQQQLRYTDSDAEGNEDAQVRQLLLEGEAVRVSLELLGAPDPHVKMQAFLAVSEFVESHPTPQIVCELLLGSEDQGGSHALLSLVRAISDENRSDATATPRHGSTGSTLLVALGLLNMLLAEDALKAKLTPTTYDVVLQVVVGTPAPPSASTYQARVVNEALKALVTMTRAGQIANLCAEAALVSSVTPLVQLLRGSQIASDGSGSGTASTIRLNALFLLVNFASSAPCRDRMARGGALPALLGVLQATEGGGSALEDQVVQLALLGVALLTTNGCSDAAAVVELSAAIEALVRLLSSKSTSIQANAVWVVSNISSEASLKDAIVARGGATALQAMLNDNMSPDEAPSAGDTGAGGAARPTSSSLRIREYAPKAIRALGFAPITPSTPPQ